MRSAILSTHRQRRSLFDYEIGLREFDSQEKRGSFPGEEATAGANHHCFPCRQGRNCRGFTLVELLIVMAVMLTISAIAVPSLMSALEQARIARAVGDIKAIEDDIALYQVINGVLPDNLSQVGFDNYHDPWGNTYCYLNHATMKGNGQARKDRFLVPLNSDYDLYSMGSDGKSSPPITARNSLDDIIRASNGAYTGLASQF